MSGRVLLLAPVLLLLTLVIWSVSSPVGSSPDEDYHLVSIWCATGDDDACLREDGATEAMVPSALVGIACFAFDSTVSGECQQTLDFAGRPDEVTERGNFFGAYPPGFYGAMSLFVGSDIESSVVTMRVVLSLVFTAFATALFLLLPVTRRPTLVWSWAITTVPLGLFMLTAVNPTAWAVAGVGFGWLALAGFLESRGWRKAGLGVLFALAVLMASGSRGDAAGYMVLAILAVLVLQFRRDRRFALDATLAAAGVAVCLLLFRVSRPAEAISSGVDEGTTTFVGLLGRALATLVDVPALWLGVFGRGWGLGWLDTSMPSVVWVATVGCFLGVAAVAGFRSDVRKAIVLGGGLAVLLFFPAAVLVAAGDVVGANLQPRYLLPLVVLFAGILIWAPRGGAIELGRTQRIVVVGALSLAQSVALYLNLARYVSGYDDLSGNLDNRIEWWWDSPVSPMTVWVLGSIAFGTLMVLVLGRPARADGPTVDHLAPREETRV